VQVSENKNKKYDLQEIDERLFCHKYVIFLLSSIRKYFFTNTSFYL